MAIPDIVMGIYDREVISIIGRDIWDHILNDATSGILNSQHMCDICRLLNPKVGGNHSRRIKDEKRSCDAVEMREVLSDYYAVEMYSLDSHAAVKKLIDIFRDDKVDLPPLAHYVEQCLENVKRIVLLGSTGDRKSSLANALLGLKSNEVFKESSMTESCTVTTTEQNGAWLGTGSLCTIIDTPGMNDSQGRDLDQVDHILETLKKDRWVNTFLVVRKGDNLRMDARSRVCSKCLR